MRKGRSGAGLMFLACFVLISIGCAAIPEVRVDYTIPQARKEYESRKISLSVRDVRKDRDLLSASARNELKNFGGSLYLSVAEQGKKGFMIGLFQPPELIREAFERRLSSMGMVVLEGDENGAARLEILLEEFLLDVVDRNWVVSIGYKAVMRTPAGRVHSQSVSGQAQRLKFVGTDQLNDALSEIFTDLVNRLDTAHIGNEQ